MPQAASADIALIGLAVMGQNLILNMADHGFTVVAFNRSVDKVDAFLQGAAKEHANVIGAHSIAEMIGLLKRPRKIMMMVKAGEAVDALIAQLLPYLEAGDVVIDGGNAHFPDSIRRTQELAAKGILFVGAGVSGGEEGARHGPSIMPSGSDAAWPLVKDIFQTIAAKVDDGTPCCDWIGQDGAGHYVKMTHNGIEYGDMQLINEAYALMKQGLGLDNNALRDVFDAWNKTELDSYLIEITRDILGFRDAKGEAVVDRILDAAGQKGTGKWTTISALDLGVPVTLIGEAVYARSLSALKDERVQAAAVLPGPKNARLEGVAADWIEAIRQALLASKIVSYAQGFMLMREAAKTYNWNLNYGAIALVWRGGCIIRSVFLGKIKEAFDRRPDLPNVLLDPYFNDLMAKCQDGWRRVVAAAATAGIPVPALSTALAFYDGYRAERLPANLLQAQRDYFGAHTYERLDAPRGTFFHTDWTGRGGDAAAGQYNA
jgi:6-phosphogluconate dehydrogenase